LQLAKLIEENQDDLANLEALDNGKSKVNALADVRGCVNVLKYYSGWPDKIHGNTIPAGQYFMVRFWENMSSRVTNFMKV